MDRWRDMRRTDWKRILKRDYCFGECCFKGHKGMASLLTMKEASEPMRVHCGGKDTTIVREGYSWLQLVFQDSHFWVTAMYDEQNRMIEIYFDITGQVRMEKENPMFEDMYLDIVLHPDGALFVLDRDELDEAYHAGEITAEEYRLALAECEKLYSYLSENWKAFADFCYEQLLRFKAGQIA